MKKHTYQIMTYHNLLKFGNNLSSSIFVCRSIVSRRSRISANHCRKCLDSTERHLPASELPSRLRAGFAAVRSMSSIVLLQRRPGNSYAVQRRALLRSRLHFVISLHTCCLCGHLHHSPNFHQSVHSGSQRNTDTLSGHYQWYSAGKYP